MFNFFAYIARMKYIVRWSLMRNSVTENIQEHSHMVAVLAHALALIQRDILHEPADPDRCAAAATWSCAWAVLSAPDVSATVLIVMMVSVGLAIC